MSAEEFHRYDSMKLFLHQIYEFRKVNLYFGNRRCLDAVATFIHKPLNRLSPEEDFMLGTMLGYDIAGQCERYCKRLREQA